MKKLFISIILFGGSVFGLSIDLKVNARLDQILSPEARAIKRDLDLGTFTNAKAREIINSFDTPEKQDQLQALMEAYESRIIDAADGALTSDSMPSWTKLQHLLGALVLLEHTAAPEDKLRVHDLFEQLRGLPQDHPILKQLNEIRSELRDQTLTFNKLQNFLYLPKYDVAYYLKDSDFSAYKDRIFQKARNLLSSRTPLSAASLDNSIAELTMLELFSKQPDKMTAQLLKDQLLDKYFQENPSEMPGARESRE